MRMPAATVLMRGVLRGIDRQESCELLLKKELLAGPYRAGEKRYRYTQCTVLHAPADLPDGDYTISTADGFQFPAVRRRGQWLRDEPQGSGLENSRESA